jgi:hypothetical protein
VPVNDAEPLRGTLADEFLPVYEVSDPVAVVVDANPDATWRALLRADLIEVGPRRPLVGVLGALRALPDLVSHVLHGERPAAPAQPLPLHELARLPLGDGGWTFGVGSGAHVLVAGLLEVVRDDAEARTADTGGDEPGAEGRDVA